MKIAKEPDMGTLPCRELRNDITSAILVQRKVSIIDSAAIDEKKIESSRIF